MGKKNKLSLDNKFTLFIKLSRRIPNAVNISKFIDNNLFVYKKKIEKLFFSLFQMIR